jgi:hypothetical protein
MLEKLYHYVQKKESEPLSCTEINLKWNMIAEIVKLVEGNIGENFLDFGFDNDFWTLHKKLRLQKYKQSSGVYQTKKHRKVNNNIQMKK